MNVLRDIVIRGLSTCCLLICGTNIGDAPSQAGAGRLPSPIRCLGKRQVRPCILPRRTRLMDIYDIFPRGLDFGDALNLLEPR